MLKLDPRTLVLLDECFGAHVCSVCGFRAQRFFVGKFYCADCCPRIPRSPKIPAMGVKTAKDPNPPGKRRSLGL